MGIEGMPIAGEVDDLTLERTDTVPNDWDDIHGLAIEFDPASTRPRSPHDAFDGQPAGPDQCPSCRAPAAICRLYFRNF
jgi:hypothetical protein